jgi:hypothetical protein
LDQEPDEGTPRTRTRRIVAFLVVLAGVGLVIASYYVDDLGICRAQPSGDEQTCEPLGVAHLIPFLIVALALMWPEWSELGIGGVISIKKALERQAERQERLQEAVVNLQQQLSQTTTVHKLHLSPRSSGVSGEKATVREGSRQRGGSRQTGGVGQAERTDGSSCRASEARTTATRSTVPGSVERAQRLGSSGVGRSRAVGCVESSTEGRTRCMAQFLQG